MLCGSNEVKVFLPASVDILLSFASVPDPVNYSFHVPMGSMCVCMCVCMCVFVCVRVRVPYTAN